MISTSEEVVLDRHGIPIKQKSAGHPVPAIKSVVIEGAAPELDGGRYAVKREIGDTVAVSADIYTDGHGQIAALLRYRKKGVRGWSEVPMVRGENFRWSASFSVTQAGRYQYTIQAFPDVFRTWLEEVQKKSAASVDISSELLEGKRIITEAGKRATKADRTLFTEFLDRMDASLAVAQAVAIEVVATPAFAALMDRYPDKDLATEYDRVLEVIVDRVEARYAAWYEMFPRSQGSVPGQSASFRDCEARLPDIRAMGFNVIYFPPIHPIGVTNRKGPNNSLLAAPDDPGCPYAIGNRGGGHKAVEPSLGTLADFEHFVAACREQGMEVALDFAINCSPDHPYVHDHPDWFYKRPDGSIKYAENPPKKYEDIYPLDFYCEDREGLWNEMKSIIEFWILHGVNIFRVDNPHTKPLVFWEWLIAEIQKDHPQVIFLSEAFTHPKMMRVLAKAGFTQSYTYFTWRNHKQEITEYFEELTQGPMREYFRGNLFTNTPDILPTILQEGGRPAFKMRATLAATLSSVYGIYSGFELCENTPVPGREEYLHSEKYEFKVWDWYRPGNIKSYITVLNQIREENPALREYDNLQFYQSDNENILAYGKRSSDGRNNIVVIVNLNPWHAQESMIHLPLAQFGMHPDQSYEVHDLITDARYYWQGASNYVRLDPTVESAHVLRIGY